MQKNLKTFPNPDNRKDWTITVELPSPSALSLCFIPDKLIANHNDIKENLNSYYMEKWDCPEEMLFNIIEFFNNALVPLWLEVTYKSDNCIITVEDSQPGLDHVKARTH